MDNRTRKRIEGLQKEINSCRKKMYLIENTKPEAYNTARYLLLCAELRTLEERVDDLTLALEFFTRYPENPK